MLGPLQFEFLKSQGLEPQHRLLDVGCGSLRGGVHAIGYLEPGHYFGIEKESSLLEAGRSVELPRYGIADREPRLHVTGTFDLSWVDTGVEFDFAIAQSVFTHLRPDLIRQCLRSVLPRLAREGVFYATFFEAEEEDVLGPDHGWREDELQHPVYTLRTLQGLAKEVGGTVEYIGAWGHPRDQRMLAIRRAPEVDHSP